MNCPKCNKDFESHHHRQKYCDECRGNSLSMSREAKERINSQLPDLVNPLGPLDVYAPERWSKLQSNYEFDPQLGRARCKEMSSNIAFPSPGDPAYRETPPPEEMLTFNDLPIHDRMVIDHESDDSDPELTREALIECALKYQRIFGGVHAHEFGAKK